MSEKPDKLKLAENNFITILNAPKFSKTGI